jgi:hypothetical protein
MQTSDLVYALCVSSGKTKVELRGASWQAVVRPGTSLA